MAVAVPGTWYLPDRGDGRMNMAVSGSVGDYPVPWEDNFNWPTLDAEGWAVFTPSPDSRIMYVSNAGNDGTGVVYGDGDFADPFNPSGEAAFATLAGAEANMRTGFPDWVLFKRGDSWDLESGNNFSPVNGRSVTERSLYGAYGSESLDRPYFDCQPSALIAEDNGTEYIAWASLSFEATYRNPDDANFAGLATAHITPFYPHGTVAEPSHGLYMEDCSFKYLQCGADGRRTEPDTSAQVFDLIWNRVHVYKSWEGDNSANHAQGFGGNQCSIWTQECVLDHNGWLTQQPTENGNATGSGYATQQNHNAYWSSAYDCVVRRCMSLRSSSLGWKLTANGGGIKMARMLHDGNLFAHGETGVSADGNSTVAGSSARFEDMYIVNNVLVEIGMSRPTNRAIAWGIPTADWQTGAVENNLLANYGNGTTVDGVDGIQICRAAATGDFAHDISVKDNKVVGLIGNAAGSDASLTLSAADDIGNVTIENNILAPGAGMSAITSDAASVAGSTASGNVVDTGAPLVDGSTYNTVVAYEAAIGEEFGENRTFNFVDDTRDLSAYDAFLGGPGTVDNFAERMHDQRKGNWIEALTTAAVTSWIRAGFEEA